MEHKTLAAAKPVPIVATDDSEPDLLELGIERAFAAAIRAAERRVVWAEGRRKRTALEAAVAPRAEKEIEHPRAGRQRIERSGGAVAAAAQLDDSLLARNGESEARI